MMYSDIRVMFRYESRQDSGVGTLCAAWRPHRWWRLAVSPVAPSADERRPLVWSSTALGASGAEAGSVRLSWLGRLRQNLPARRLVLAAGDAAVAGGAVVGALWSWSVRDGVPFTWGYTWEQAAWLALAAVWVPLLRAVALGTTFSLTRWRTGSWSRWRTRRSTGADNRRRCWTGSSTTATSSTSGGTAIGCGSGESWPRRSTRPPRGRTQMQTRPHSEAALASDTDFRSFRSLRSLHSLRPRQTRLSPKKWAIFEAH